MKIRIRSGISTPQCSRSQEAGSETVKVTHDSPEPMYDPRPSRIPSATHAPKHPSSASRTTNSAPPTCAPQRAYSVRSDIPCWSRLNSSVHVRGRRARAGKCERNYIGNPVSQLFVRKRKGGRVRCSRARYPALRACSPYAPATVSRAAPPHPSSYHPRQSPCSMHDHHRNQVRRSRG